MDHTRPLSPSEINDLLGFDNDEDPQQIESTQDKIAPPIPSHLAKMLGEAPAIIRGTDTAFHEAIAEFRTAVQSGTAKNGVIPEPKLTARDLVLIHAQAMRIGECNARQGTSLRVDYKMPEIKEMNPDEEYLGTKELTNISHGCNVPIQYAFKAIEELIHEGIVIKDEEYSKKYGQKSNNGVIFIGGKSESIFFCQKWYGELPSGAKFIITMDKNNGWNPIFIAFADEQNTINAMAEFDRIFNERSETLFYKDCRGKTLNLQLNEVSMPDDDTDLILPEKMERDIFHPLNLFHKKDPKVTRRAEVLYGLPGTGKTKTVRKIIKEKPEYTTAFVIPAGSITRPSEVNELLKLARKLTPCIIIIDDGENLLEDRSTSKNAEIPRAMINELDSFHNNNGIVIYITTNFPERLDPALGQRPGRITGWHKYPLPTPKQREQFIKDLIKTHKNPSWADDECIKKMVEESNEKTFDQIQGGFLEMTVFDGDIEYFKRTLLGCLILEEKEEK